MDAMIAAPMFDMTKTVFIYIEESVETIGLEADLIKESMVNSSDHRSFDVDGTISDGGSYNIYKDVDGRNRGGW